MQSFKSCGITFTKVNDLNTSSNTAGLYLQRACSFTLREPELMNYLFILTIDTVINNTKEEKKLKMAVPFDNNQG